MHVMGIVYYTYVDGLYYDLKSDGTAAVSPHIKYGRGEYSQDYSGDVVIPPTVTYNKRTYRVTSINEGAFSHCSDLNSVTIPNSITYIGYEAFYWWHSLNSIYITDLAAWCNIKDDDSCLSYSHLFLNGEEVKDLIIPNGVTSISDWAFSCSGLTYVSIPNSVTSIGYGAFSRCSGLSTIKSEIENPFVLDTRVFSNVYARATLIVPKGKKSAYNSTEGWKNFKYIVEEGEFVVDDIYYKIDENNTASVIKGNREYSGDIVIPAYVNYDGKTYNVTSIDEYAFQSCSGLTSVTIPNSVTSIGYGAFLDCSGLTSVTIPNSVTSIGYLAFWDCSGLTSITIPNSVTSIGDAAFRYCSSLTTIVSKIENPYKIDTNLFYEFYSTATLYVPVGKKSAYEATEGWNQFVNIKEIVDGDVNLDEKVNVNDQNVLVAHIMGEKPEGFYEGLADLNGDDDVNAADVVTLVNILNNGGLSTDSQFDFDYVDGNLVVSALTCTLNNERDEAIQLKECELLLNGNLVSSRTFSGSSATMAAGANKSCSFGNLTRFATRTGFSVLWHYTVNGEAFVYRCPLTD